MTRAVAILAYLEPSNTPHQRDDTYQNGVVNEYVRNLYTCIPY